MTEQDNSETIVELKDGCTLRSSSKKLMAGDYVRLCNPEGDELYYWDYTEWETDPQLVMGAIMRAASGIRI